MQFGGQKLKGRGHEEGKVYDRIHYKLTKSSMIAEPSNLTEMLHG